MASGLLALLDDVAALVKASAATLDDIPAQVMKTGGKVSGVVIDDAAVTPKYVVGLDPSRELSIIARIARHSLLNKLLILTPAALLLGYFAPWIITPILMLGGSYLCVEGYEKVHAMWAKKPHAEAIQQATPITPEKLEAIRVKSAVRTDLILSGEITAITYANVADAALMNQLIVLAVVAFGITALVYGFVGLLVKVDDIGLHLATHSRYEHIRRFGCMLVRGMPGFLTWLGLLGTAAMLWVGAGIIVHGIPVLHHALESLQHAIYPPAIGWVAGAILLTISGLLFGALLGQLLHALKQLRKS